MCENAEIIKAFTTAQPGWRAVYFEDGQFNTEPLVGWAVIEKNREDEIIPQVWRISCSSVMDPTEEEDTFCSILAPGEDVPTVDSERGQDWILALKEKEEEERSVRARYAD